MIQKCIAGHVGARKWSLAGGVFDSLPPSPSGSIRARTSAEVLISSISVVASSTRVENSISFFGLSGGDRGFWRRCGDNHAN